MATATRRVALTSGLRAVSSGGCRLGRRRGATCGLRSAARSPTPTAILRLRLGRGDRVLVGAEHLLGDLRPREPPDVGGRRAGHPGTAVGLVVEVAQRLGERLRVGDGHEHAVDAVTDDVAVAGDVGCDHRGAGGERLGQHHPEALPAQRRRAQDVGALQLLALARIVDLAQHVDAAIVEHQRSELLARGADHGELGGDVLAQGLERAQQQRQPLALDRLTDEHDRQPVGAARCAGAGQHVGIDADAVGNHAIVPAEEAPARPGRGLRDRDPHVQTVEHAARAHRVGQAVGELALAVGVEGADERQPGRVGGDPAGERRDGLMDVHDVVAAAAQLVVERRHAVRGDRQIRDRAVGLEADRAAQRHQVVGHRQRLRGRAAVQDRRVQIHRVIRREHADVMALGEELFGERLDMPGHTPRVGPRIGRYQRDPHPLHVTGLSRRGIFIPPPCTARPLARPRPRPRSVPRPGNV
jgi:hypothetical protein